MSLGSFYRGTTIEQDGRFKNKEKKIFANLNIPKELETPIDISRIEMKVIKEWIDRKIKSINIKTKECKKKENVGKTIQ